jgi:hypothetical protein
MRVLKALCVIVAGSITAFFTASACAVEWQTVYSTDFSSDPGWTTNDPTNLYWDESGGRLHVKFINGANQFIYKNVSYSPNVSYRLEFDLALSHMDDSGFAMFGMSDDTMNAYESATWYACYSKGIDTAVSLQYDSDTETGRIGGGGNRYDLNTEYHNVLMYDCNSQIMTLDIASGESTIYHFSGSAGIFTGIDRLGGIGIGVQNEPSKYSEGFIDNVVLSTIPEPSMVELFIAASISLLGYAWRRRRQAV